MCVHMLQRLLWSQLLSFCSAKGTFRGQDLFCQWCITGMSILSRRIFIQSILQLLSLLNQLKVIAWLYYVTDIQFKHFHSFCKIITCELHAEYSSWSLLWEKTQKRFQWDFLLVLWILMLWMVQMCQLHHTVKQTFLLPFFLWQTLVGFWFKVLAFCTKKLCQQMFLVCVFFECVWSFPGLQIVGSIVRLLPAGLKFKVLVAFSLQFTDDTVG